MEGNGSRFRRSYPDVLRLSSKVSKITFRGQIKSGRIPNSLPASYKMTDWQLCRCYLHSKGKDVGLGDLRSLEKRGGLYA